MAFHRPYYTQTPNEIFDEWLPVLSHPELLCLLYVVRHTTGYHRNDDRISLTQFCTGARAKDGTIIDAGTGLKRRAVILALNRLVALGLLLREHANVGPRGRGINVYKLNVDPEPEPDYAPRE